MGLSWIDEDSCQVRLILWHIERRKGIHYDWTGSRLATLNYKAKDGMIIFLYNIICHRLGQDGFFIMKSKSQVSVRQLWRCLFSWLSALKGWDTRTSFCESVYSAIDAWMLRLSPVLHKMVTAQLNLEKLVRDVETWTGILIAIDAVGLA